MGEIDQWVYHEGSIRRRIAPLADKRLGTDLKTKYKQNNTSIGFGSEM